MAISGSWLTWNLAQSSNPDAGLANIREALNPFRSVQLIPWPRNRLHFSRVVITRLLHVVEKRRELAFSLHLEGSRYLPKRRSQVVQGCEHQLVYHSLALLESGFESSS